MKTFYQYWFSIHKDKKLRKALAGYECFWIKKGTDIHIKKYIPPVCLN